jgi:hypothetical protein
MIHAVRMSAAVVIGVALAVATAVTGAGSSSTDDDGVILTFAVNPTVDWDSGPDMTAVLSIHNHTAETGSDNLPQTPLHLQLSWPNFLGKPTITGCDAQSAVDGGDGTSTSQCPVNLTGSAIKITKVKMLFHMPATGQGAGSITAIATNVESAEEFDGEPVSVGVRLQPISISLDRHVAHPGDAVLVHLHGIAESTVVNLIWSTGINRRFSILVPGGTDSTVPLTLAPGEPLGIRSLYITFGNSNVVQQGDVAVRTPLVIQLSNVLLVVPGGVQPNRFTDR